MNSTTHSAELGPDAYQCRQCGYDLRGTALGGSCPECGLAVITQFRGVRVDKQCLVVKSGVILPPRCVKTNVLVEGKPRKKTLTWAHPAWLLLFLVNIIVGLIVYALVQKKCKIQFSLCDEERLKYRKRAWMIAALILAAFGFGAGAIATEEYLLFIPCAVLVFSGLLFAIVAGAPIRLTRARGEEFWVKGCGPEFLQSFELPG